MSKITIGVVGVLQSGKSLLINCLLQRNIATIGDGCATTHAPTYYSFSKEEYAEVKTEEGFAEIQIEEVGKFDTNRTIEYTHVYLNCPILKRVTLVDLPGSDFDEKDNIASARALSGLDCAILVTTNVKSLSGESIFYTSVFNILKRENIPYYAFLNCTHMSKWKPSSFKNRSLAKGYYELLAHYPPLDYDIEEEALRVVNLMWYWCSLTDETDSLKRLFLDLLEDKSNEELREESNFSFISNIISDFNLKNLQIRKDFRHQLSALQNKVCPVGTIQAFAFDTIPMGWLVCDGQSVRINEYYALYQRIGNTFGKAEDGEFKLPDLRGRFIRGWDGEGVVDKERIFGSTQEDSVQQHNHDLKIEGEITDAGSHTHSLYYQKSTILYGRNTFSSDYEALMMRMPVTWSKYHDEKYGKYNWYKDDYLSHSVESAGSHSHNLPKMSVDGVCGEKVFISEETRPKNLALLYCIKAFDEIGPSYVNCINLSVKSMRCSGLGVYERFIWLNRPVMLSSNITPIQFPLLVEYHDDKKEEIVLQRVDRYEPINIREEGLHFVRFVMSENSDTPIKQDHVEIFKIDSMGLIGDFNQWETSLPMHRVPDSLLFEAELDLAPGRYEFKFRANNNWSVELSGNEKDLISWLGDNLVIESNGHPIKITLDLSSHPWSYTIGPKD